MIVLQEKKGCFSDMRLTSSVGLMQDQIANRFLPIPTPKMPTSAPRNADSASSGGPGKYLMSAQNDVHQRAAGQGLLTAPQRLAAIGTPCNGPSNQEMSLQETPDLALTRPMQQPPRNPAASPRIGLPGTGSQRPPGLGLNERTAAAILPDPQPASQGFFWDPHQQTAPSGLVGGHKAGLNDAQTTACQANAEGQRETITHSAKQLPILNTATSNQASDASQEPGCRQRTETAPQERNIDGSPPAMQDGAERQSCPRKDTSFTPLTQNLQGTNAVGRHLRDRPLPPRSALLLATLSPSGSDERDVDPTQRSTGKGCSTFS